MPKLKSLSLIFIGVIVGFVISFSTDIQAATNKLLGGKVTKVVTVKKDGVVIGEGGIINGTTLLPVRSLVNSIEGIEVGEVSSSEINLISSDQAISSNDLYDKAKQEQDEMDKKIQNINEITRKIRDVKSKIKRAQGYIDDANNPSTKQIEDIIRKYENNPNDDQKSDIDNYKKVIEKINSEAELASKEIETLKQELIILKSQLSELQK